jgi:uncharacterized protein YpbB
MENLNEKVFELFDEGFSATKISQKLKVKKAVVKDILGEAANKGLGSIVEEFTEVTGIKSVVEAVTDDCGCKARAEKLNKLFPNRNLNDLLDEQYTYLENYFENKKSYVSRKEQSELIGIYNHVFNSKRKVSSCGTCVAKVIGDLKKIFDGATN